MAELQFFSDLFEKLRGVPPYPWQRKLFQQMVSGDWPEVVDMPTGSGKTALLWIWWLALVWSRLQNATGIPIRLAWVVNRRVVVDQVTSEIEDLCAAWRQIGFDAFRDPPAVSTLRGQLADKGDWLRDPCVPSIVVGTVDMIGSRLLFRGYRSGPYWRPVETGLLGVDTLVVNDEAHLSPAFAKLLCEVQDMRPAERIEGKSFRYMLLSATQSDDERPRFEHDPQEDAAESKRFHEVWSAEKQLSLREMANGLAVEAAMWKLATQEPASRTIIFIDKPEDALKFYLKLTSEGFTAELMTGTMRGHERDELVTRDAFKLFQRADPGEKPVFLVATSAAEVGVNLTCERMITGLCEADHLLQRFGRMNRFGVDSGNQPIKGEAFVVYVASKKEDRLKATLAYLEELGDDVSPQKLWSQRPPQEARAEQPSMVRLQKWRIESWAQTNYRDHQMARVEPWLHGQQEKEPQTEVTWRADLKYLLDWGAPESDIEKILQVFPILARERLQEPSWRVFEKLKKVSEKLEGRDDRIVIVDQDQSVGFCNISALKKKEYIENRLVLLPGHIGRVERHGMFEPEVGEPIDVATSEERIRLLYREDHWEFLGAGLGELPEDSSRPAIGSFAKRNEFRAPVIIRNATDESDQMLVYFTKRNETKKSPLREVALKEHRQAVAERARQLAIAAGLGQDLADRYRDAGFLHDEGKDHDLWQTAMGAKERPAAKTITAANSALLNGYRHEFGSLLKAGDEKDDLVLHLVATHHASGRPFFEPRQYDPWRMEKECYE